MTARKLVTLCYCGFAVSSGLLWIIAWRASHSVHLIYAGLVLVGVVRAFNAPVSRALLAATGSGRAFPQCGGVERQHLSRRPLFLARPLADFFMRSSHGPSVVYVTATVTAIAAVFSTLRITLQTQARPREPVNWTTVLAGFRYIWEQKLVLGSISLDMFAVLLGGAVALLPVYASEILKTGPWGLGLLRSAPGVGAAAMAILVAHRPLRRRAGLTMLWCVAGFGVCTIIFGLSRSLVLSLVSLLLLGATDMISVIVRSILVQLATPDEMRGRVNAVDMIFIGVSNELGQFESGLTAHWFGTVPAVVLGGVGTLGSDWFVGVDLPGTAECRSDHWLDHTNHVGADVLICPAERSSAFFWLPAKICRASLDRTDEDICPYVVLLASDHRLRRTHVVEAVVDSDHDDVLGRHFLCFQPMARIRRHRHLEVITRGL